MDFLQGFFDIQTLRLISGSGPDIEVPHDGAPVFVRGRKVPLFNAYDALEMALKDELLTTIQDNDVIELVCDLIMNDLVLAKDEASSVADIVEWFATPRIAAACMMEIVLPVKLVEKISLRMKSCLKGICKIMGTEEIITRLC